MLEYGVSTEFIIWDEMIVGKVEKIPYKEFSRPERTVGHGQSVQLVDLVPIFLKAGQYWREEGGISRTKLATIIYSSAKEEQEREDYMRCTAATRNGRLPPTPNSVKTDKRVEINDKLLEDVWAFVRRWNHQGLLFMILSLLTQTFVAESIVQRVVERYPEVVEESLELISRPADSSEGPQAALVFHMALAERLGREDVNTYERMRLDCVKLWYSRVRKDPSHRWHGLKVYLRKGPTRPLRNLLRARQVGFMGNCKVEPVLQATQGSLETLSFSQMTNPVYELKLPETDEEHRARLERETGNRVYAPANVHMRTTKRVHKGDTSHRSAKRRSAPNEVTDETRRQRLLGKQQWPA